MKLLTQNEWIVSQDTGASSITMWAALNGVDIDPASYRWSMPYDASDFGRCYRFAKFCGLTKDDLALIKERVHWFAPLIDDWDNLVGMYDVGQRDTLYIRLRQLRKESDVLRKEAKP